MPSRQRCGVPHQFVFWILPICVATSAAVAAQAPVSGTDALTAQMDAVCAGASSGSALAARCAVILASADPNAREIAADHNDLEEIPGAGRGAAKDQWPSRAEIDTLLTPKLALFASLDHARVARADDAIEAAFDSDATTFTVGLDWHPARRWQLGLAVNTTHENQDFRHSSGRTQSDSNGVIAVTSVDLNDHFVVDGYYGKARGGQDIRRVVSFIDGSTPIAETASPGIRRDFGGAALDANFAHGAWTWLGSAGFDVARTTFDAYAEHGGSGFDLIVPQRATFTQRGRLELGLSDTVSTRWGVWQPEMRLGLIHEFGNDARVVGVRFVDDANATVVRFDTGAPDRDWALATLSSTFVLAHGNSGFISIAREFGHSTATATDYAIGWRIEL